MQVSGWKPAGGCDLMQSQSTPCSSGSWLRSASPAEVLMLLGLEQADTGQSYQKWALLRGTATDPCYWLWQSRHSGCLWAFHTQVGGTATHPNLTQLDLILCWGGRRAETRGWQRAEKEGEGVKMGRKTLVNAGEGKESDREKQRYKNRGTDRDTKEQTLPWHAPVRWFGMNPRRQGWGWAGHISQGWPHARPTVAQHRVFVQTMPVSWPWHIWLFTEAKQGPVR